MFGWRVVRRYGFFVTKPEGNCFFASSSDTAGEMMTSSPAFQSAPVETLWPAVSCSESMTRRISWKLRPVLGRLVDETSLGFACGAVEALIREIRLHRAAEAAER